MYLFMLLFSFSLNKNSEVEWLGHMVPLFLVFLEIFILFSIMTIPIYLLTNCMQGFLFLHILTNICYLLLFDKSLSNMYEVVSIVVWCAFPWWLVTFISFSCTYSFLIKLIFKFFIELYIFYIFCILIFIREIICKYVFQFHALLSHFAVSLFCRAF